MYIERVYIYIYIGGAKLFPAFKPRGRNSLDSRKDWRKDRSRRKFTRLAEGWDLGPGARKDSRKTRQMPPSRPQHLYPMRMLTKPQMCLPSDAFNPKSLRARDAFDPTSSLLKLRSPAWAQDPILDNLSSESLATPVEKQPRKRCFPIPMNP